jgi:hypothetical protein
VNGVKVVRMEKGNTFARAVLFMMADGKMTLVMGLVIVPPVFYIVCQSNTML